MVYAFFQGHLGADARMLKGSNNEELIAMNVATDTYDKDKPIWVDCIGKYEPFKKMFQYLKKGKGVIITGTIRPDKWTDKNQVVQTVLRCNVTSIDFDNSGRSASGGTASNGDAQAQEPAQPQPAQPQPVPAQPAEPLLDNGGFAPGDDLPF
jgi:single-stranded DNA-binding protein